MAEKHIVLIPAYEPDNSMILLLEELKKEGFSAVVVDDGSGDAALSLFQEAENHAVVLHHEKNCGKGAALKTGLRYISEHFGENVIVITMDADGQHTVVDAKRIFCEAAKFPDALVLGSRCFAGKVPFKSRFGNTITRLVFAVSSGQKLMDTQTGLRGFWGKRIPEMLAIGGERYEYEMNVLMYCAKHHILMLEVPIETIYLNGNQSSHFHAVKDSARIYREIIKYSAVSFISFGLDYLLYAVFLALTGIWPVKNGILISNVAARLLSASFNFAMNRKFVFENETNIGPAAVKYTLLAGMTLAVNTGLLGLLTGRFGVNPMFAKPIIEMLLFLVNFTVQKTVIFPMKAKADNGMMKSRARRA